MALKQITKKDGRELDMLISKLNQGKKVYLIELQGKDPNEIGFNKFTNLIQNSVSLDYYDLMTQKLSLV